ncbi:MAG: hypothetical protein AAGE98_07555 [Actinomycetota bacterium]
MTTMTPTELRERLDRIADAHVGDLETTLPVPASGGPPTNRSRLVLVAAAVAILAGSWFLVRTTGDDGEESPAVRIETLSEPQLNLPAWTELPVVDLDELEPWLAELFRERDLDVDLSTLRLVDADGARRFVGLSADHRGTFYGMPTGNAGSFATGGSPGSVMLLNDNLVVRLGFGDPEMRFAEDIGLIPARIDAVLAAGERFETRDGLLNIRVEGDEPIAGLSTTTIDGSFLRHVTTIGEPGSFVRGVVIAGGGVADFDFESAVCLRTPEGLHVAAGHAEGRTYDAFSLGPEGVHAQRIATDPMLYAIATADEVEVVELGGDRVRVEIDGNGVSGEVEIQCVNPPTLEMLVSAMRGER